MKGKSIFFKSFLLTLLVAPLLDISPVEAATGDRGNQQIYFDSSPSQTGSRMVTLPSKAILTGVSVNNGSVSYSQSGQNLTVNVSGGSSTGGSYDPKMYSKNGSTTKTSSSNYFDSSISYTDGGYSGTLTKSGSSYVYSGSYTSSSNKTVTLPLADQSVVDNTLKCIKNPTGTTMRWDITGTSYRQVAAQNIPYDQDGYKGTLYRGTEHKTVSGVTEGEYCTAQGRVTTSTSTIKIDYTGTVTRPESDTRVYAQAYSGTIYQGGSNPTYSYTVTASYILDESAPVADLSYSPSSWTNGSVTIYLSNIYDIGSAGLRYVRLPNGVTTSSSSVSYNVTSNGTYSFVLEDNLGNQSVKTATITNIDTSPPTGTLSQTPTGWTNGSVTLNLSNVSDSGSGIKRITFPNGTTTSTSSASMLVNSNGTYTFTMEDYAGNTATKSITVSNIDTVAPSGTLTQNPTSWTNSAVTLNLSGISDGGGSGISRTKLPNGSFATGTSASYSVSSNGTYVFEIYDNAGNVTTKSISVSNIDMISPTGDLTQSTTSWTNGNVTLNLTGVSDTGGSGFKRILLPDGSSVSSTSTSYLVSSNGTYSFKIEDNAGNVTSKSINITNIDKQAPTGNLTASTTAWTNQDVTLTLSSIIDNGGSGLKEIRLPDGSTRTGSSVTYTVSTNGTYAFKLLDNAGNQNIYSISVSNIDKDLPDGTISYDGSTPLSGLKIQVQAEDKTSGIKRIILPNGTSVYSDTTNYFVKSAGDYSFTLEDVSGSKKVLTANVLEPDWSLRREGLEVVVSINSRYTSTPITKRSENAQSWTTKTIRLPITKNEVFTFSTNDGGILTPSKTLSIADFFAISRPQVEISYDTTTWKKDELPLHIQVTSPTNDKIVSVDLPDGNKTSLTDFSYSVTDNGLYTFVAYDDNEKVGMGSVVVKNMDKEAPEIILDTPPNWVSRDVPVDIQIVNH